MSASEIIVPAAPGTTYLFFPFTVTSRARDSEVKSGTIRRPILAWKMQGGRPLPIVVGFPIAIDPEVGG